MTSLSEFRGAIIALKEKHKDIMSWKWIGDVEGNERRNT